MTKLGFLLLSGGQSRRMGTHKALLEIGEGMLLDTIAKAGEGFDEQILSANDPAIPTPAGFVRCADVYPGCGPMAGIHAALAMTACDALVTAPCDAPNMQARPIPAALIASAVSFAILPSTALSVTSNNVCSMVERINGIA